MVKNMAGSSEQSMNRNSTELIVYQIGEVKNLLTNLTQKVDQNQEKIEKRLSLLEIWRAGEEEKSKNAPKFDTQKIVLAAFGIASGAIALGLALVQAGVVK